MGPIIYIMGVAGSGKTLIGRLLSEKLHIPFLDGDDFHPPANVEKMRSAQALNDSDREGWLIAINRAAASASKEMGAVIACSALKEKYRIVLAQDLKVRVHWVYLAGDFTLISERMRKRSGHFMPEALLQSQFDTLEVPSDAIEIDIRKAPTEIVDEIVDRLRHLGT